MTICFTSMRRQISIHAPRGGSDVSNTQYGNYAIISIHAPRGGSDSYRNPIGMIGMYFNPRSPWGERPLTLTMNGVWV